MLRLALAGDTMLGRLVADALAERREPLLHPDVVALAAEADLFLLNLECCISARGSPWPAPGKPFFFRAPPEAAALLREWGVDCVTLANNHALDFGADALLDTLEHLETHGIGHVGAGADADAARAPRTVRGLTVIAATDHPADFAAAPGTPGVAYAELAEGVPGWLAGAIAAAEPPVLCTVHWGPNMTAEPVPHVRRAARDLLDAGATLIAGHSAHVPHGAGRRTLFDLGDFLDDYAVDPVLRNDLGLLFRVTLHDDGAIDAEAIPLALDFCRTRPARPKEARLVCERFAAASRALGTEPTIAGDRVHVRLA